MRIEVFEVHELKSIQYVDNDGFHKIFIKFFPFCHKQLLTFYLKMSIIIPLLIMLLLIKPQERSRWIWL